MKIREIKKLDFESVRNLCINNNYYTRGTQREYSKILLFVDSLGNVGLKDLEYIANDILIHSEIEQTEDKKLNIINQLNYCIRRWIEEEEEQN